MVVLFQAVLFGSLLGWGLWLMISSLPLFRLRPLHVRVGELIGDVSDAAFDAVISNGSHKFRRQLAMRSMRYKVLGPKFEQLLTQAGSKKSLVDIRESQIIWLAVGACAGAAATALLATVLGGSPSQISAGFFLGIACGSVLGMFMPGRLLVRRAKKRLARLENELTAAWEFLALSISSGETLVNGFTRLAQSSSGVFSSELNRMLTRTHVGVGLTEGLTELSNRMACPALSRGIEQLLISFSRGTPVVEVLQSLAQDARAEQHRRLIESAGKKEVAMLVPLIFLILPVTIFFAVFPGVVAINSSF